MPIANMVTQFFDDVLEIFRKVANYQELTSGEREIFDVCKKAIPEFNRELQKVWLTSPMKKAGESKDTVFDN